MNDFRLDAPVVRDQDHVLALSDAGRAALATAREVVGQKRAPLSEKEARKLLAMYERGLKDLQTGADEVVLYRHDLGRKVAFTRRTMEALQQQLRGLQIALGIAPPAAARRRWA